ncbi:MAG TPA: hydroxyacid dehydrogenase [Candidatus Binataceae bacterium]|nr:hydroxyacid dehydrogenase [Candidatus Binataceae bacterium]
MGEYKKKLLVPDTIHRAGWELLKSRPDIEVVAFSNEMSKSEFHALLGDADAVALALTHMMAPEIAAAPQLKAVGRIGVGYDGVDVSALTARRIPLLVTGTANSVSVAEHTLYFMLELVKRGRLMDQITRMGNWRERYANPPRELYGSTVLIVGFGRIGTRVAARCRAMEMTVLVYDPYVAAEKIATAGCEPMTDLDQALPRADFVTIHCPKNADTVGLFDAPRLARMKRTAYLINTARGGIIDERALYAALAEGGLGGAALDVFEREPTPQDDPLLTLERLIVSPHAAGVTAEALERMSVTTIRNLLSVLDGHPERENVVNPEVLD